MYEIIIFKMIDFENYEISQNFHFWKSSKSQNFNFSICKMIKVTKLFNWENYEFSKIVQLEKLSIPKTWKFEKLSTFQTISVPKVI